MNVYLIGFMGSGKSSLGKKLANRLDRNFIDLDQLIEKNENSSITEIFRNKGEAYFREIEKRNLLSLHSGLEAVVSLGGGACCNQESMDAILRNGLVIYVKERAEVLYGRLKNLKATRPLIADMADEALKGFIDKKLEERSVFYEKAHFNFEKDKTSFSFLVSHIEDYIK